MVPQVISDDSKKLALISEFTSTIHADCLEELEINKKYKKYILPVTNDLFLSENQFVALKSLLIELEEFDFYVAQFYGGVDFSEALDDAQNEKKILRSYKEDGILSQYNKAYKIDLSTSYIEYVNLHLYSLSVIFSSNGIWAIFVQECLDFGIGLFVSSKEIVNKYKKILSETKDIKYEIPENAYAIERYIAEDGNVELVDYLTKKLGI